MAIKQKIEKILNREFSSADTVVRSLLIEDYIARQLREEPRYADPRKLTRFEYQSFSQYGEDGIIEEIFHRIGETNRYFVEFGVETGIECNSSLLLFKGWKGLWIEGNEQSAATIRRHFSEALGNERLSLLNRFITAENIESLFTEAGVPVEPDLLSIDIDRNDYYVWKAIETFRPRVVCMEYNAIFPPSVDFVVPYAADQTWDGTSYFGASLAALNRLAGMKGYSLVGCSFAGVNAFFVRNDCLNDQFLEPGSLKTHYEPARYFLYRKEGHPRKIIL
ncbi:hypothetical protein JMG10_28370 [Nostoc ellipsosporum NOK]|nr:hypothetical protein [Nostoc ellipsosporum NOK]